MRITKCQGWAIMLYYKYIFLYVSNLQHLIKSWGMKITSLYVFAITVFYCRTKKTDKIVFFPLL